jgi:hypothetical protein
MKLPLVGSHITLQKMRDLTFKCSWASLTVFPSFFFFQLWPSFRKFLSILRSNNTIVPPVTLQKIRTGEKPANEEFFDLLCYFMKGELFLTRQNAIKNNKKCVHLVFTNCIWVTSMCGHVACWPLTQFWSFAHKW